MLVLPAWVQMLLLILGKQTVSNSLPLQLSRYVMPCWCLTLRVFINTSRGKKARSCCLSFSDKGHKKIEPSLMVHLAVVVECLLGCCNLHLLAGRCVCNHICVIRIEAYSLLLAHLTRCCWLQERSERKKSVCTERFRKVPTLTDFYR